MTRRIGPVIAALASVTCLCCSGGQNAQVSSTPTSPTSPPIDATAADLAYCVQDVNAYRARIGRSSLAEDPSLERYAAMGAQQDTSSGIPHWHFMNTNGGGIASAENEVLSQGFTGAATVQTAMHQADALFFGEGPGGPHYENMTSSAYTAVGCGVYIANGAITIVEDFR